MSALSDKSYSLLCGLPQSLCLSCIVKVHRTQRLMFFHPAPPFSPMCYCNIPTNLDSSTLLLVTHTIHTGLYLLYSLHWIRLRLALIPTRFLTPSILWSMIHLDLDIEMCQRLVPSFSPCTDAILPHVHPVCVICTQIIANNQLQMMNNWINNLLQRSNLAACAPSLCNWHTDNC